MCGVYASDRRKRRGKKIRKKEAENEGNFLLPPESLLSFACIPSAMDKIRDSKHHAFSASLVCMSIREIEKREGEGYIYIYSIKEDPSLSLSSILCGPFHLMTMQLNADVLLSSVSRIH